MSEFKAFDNDSQSFSVGAGEGLTVQNGQEVVSIWGEAKFKADEAGRKAAAELREVLQGVAAKLAAGPAEKALWVKKAAGGLSVGGDVDLEKGKSSAEALAKAIAAIDAFGVGAEPAKGAKNPKA